MDTSFRRQDLRRVFYFGTAVLLGLFLFLALLAVGTAQANSTPQTLPFSQNWTVTTTITTNDDWSAVPGIIGYLGDYTTGSPTGVDPQILVSDFTTTSVDVIANQTNPNITNGGVAEFHLANPVVALQGSGTADAPFLLINLNTTGQSGIQVAYNVRDIDATADNATQQVAMHYRIGSSGNFTNVAAAYIADATTGPSLATLVTPVSVVLPADANNQSLVQVRIMTTNAAASDEWVGIDDINITAGAGDSAPSVSSTSPVSNATGVAINANITVNFSEDVTASEGWYEISCGSSGAHTASVSGGPSSYTLDPTTDFSNSETCTVTITGTLISDTDENDPPNNLNGNYVWSFTTAAPPISIHDIQGATHISPYVGQSVAISPSIVTAIRTGSSGGFWMQEPNPDGNDATSEGIFVFTAATPSVAVGDNVSVSGLVAEFRAGLPSLNNLTITEISGPSISVISSGNPLPTPIVIGTGGRVPPHRRH